MLLRDGEYRTSLNGVTHWYRVVGAANRTVPLVVVHGGPGGNTYNFERTIGPQLAEFATLVYYDQRGCGRSDAPADPNEYSIPLLLSDLDGLRRYLQLEKIIPLGFSFGGELVLEYALAYPKHVVKLIVQAPGIGDRERTAYTQLYGFEMIAQGELKRRVQHILHEHDRPLQERLKEVWSIVDAQTVDRFLFCNPEVARANRRLWRESGLVNTGQMERALQAQPLPPIPLSDRLPQISAPTLVIVGLYDRNSGVEANRDVASLIPKARLVIFERSAHFPEMEEPEKYAETIRRFLNEEV